MHAIFAISSADEKKITACEESVLAFKDLPFHPHRIASWRRPGVLLISMESANPVFKNGSHSFQDESAFAFSGVPLIKELHDKRGRYDAGDIHDYHRSVGLHRFYKTAASSYTVVRTNQAGTVIAQSDACQRYPLFYREEEGVVAISNIPELLSKAWEGSDWHVDGQAALSLVAHGQIWGDETLFRNVRLVKTGHASIIENGKIRFAPVVGDWLSFGYEKSINVDRYAEAAQSLVDSLKVFGALTDDTISVGLSGGKDSRILAAAATKAGLGEQLSVFTGGVELSPELEIGAIICEILKVPHHKKISTPGSLTAVGYWPRMRNQIGRYQAHLLPIAGLGAASAIAPQIEITGFGGELYRRGIARQFVNRAITDVKDAASRWPNYHVGPDAAKIMQKSAIDRFWTWMENWVYQAVDEGYPVQATPELFFSRYRVPLHQGIGANYTALRLYIDPLINPAIVEAHFSYGAFAGTTELTHCSLLWNIEPALCRVPFFKDSWHDALQQYFPDVKQPPFAKDHSNQNVRPIPWDFFNEAREETDRILFGESSPKDLFEELVDQDELKRHMSSPTPLTGAGISAPIFSIFGLQLFLAGESERPKDGVKVEPQIDKNYQVARAS